MSLVTTDEVEALMATGLEETPLQGLIDREEAWLATDPHVGIGQLEGERIQRIRFRDPDADLLLERVPDPDGLEVRDNGVLLTADQVDLVGAAAIRRLDRPWRGPIVDVTFTPTDVAAVKRGILELVQLTITSSPYNQESTEGHSYSRPNDVEKAREKIALALHPHRGAMTLLAGAPR